MSEDRDFTSDVPVSRPNRKAEDELVAMGGFAFSQERGIVVSARPLDRQWVQELVQELDG